RIGYGSEVPCLSRRFSLTYPTGREALWRTRGGDLDFSSNIDKPSGTTRLRWERSGRSDQPTTATDLRLSFPSPRMRVLEFLRGEAVSDLASGEDLQAFVEGLQKKMLGKPRASEATAHALYEFVQNQIADNAPGRPLWQVGAGLSSDCFSLRRGNRWERCRLLAKLMRLAGLEAYVYAVRTDSGESPDPRQLRPLLPEDFSDCLVGWHRPFDPVVWLYPQGRTDLDFGQLPAVFSDHPVVRLNPRGPVLIERLPTLRNALTLPVEEAP
ncbi:MAG TPA: hypothetical protein VL860_09120, partial [Planctomycetota bacterium]|nr:hypothetical protein [Planctomycetota bacterium]